MPKAQYGVLGTTFKICRALQIASMIAVIGMTANFVSVMVNAAQSPSAAFIGILSVVGVSVLYCAVTVLLFLDAILPFLISSIIDICFLIALIVVSVVVGKPLSYIDCKVFGHASVVTSSVNDFTSALGNGSSGYISWVSTSTATCFETKSIWGLSIALCILFTFSAISTICLWRRSVVPVAQKDDA